MEAVIDAFLILAREADVEPQIELFDVNDIVRYEVDNANELLGARPVSVHLHSDGPVQLHAPPRVLQVVVSNLVRNACSYTDEGRIDVHVLNDGWWCATPASACPPRRCRGRSSRSTAPSQPPAGHRPGPVDRAPAVRSLRLEGQPGQRAGQGTEATVIFR
jgi:hypothetical protein